MIRIVHNIFRIILCGSMRSLSLFEMFGSLVILSAVILSNFIHIIVDIVY